MDDNDLIGLQQLKNHIDRLHNDAGIELVDWGQRETLRELLRRTEREAIIAALERHDAAMGATAKELGIARKTLWEKLRRHAIDKKTTRAQQRLI